MSTNATIIVQRPDSDPPEFASIYTHWDGYPSHHGKILLENYNTYEKVLELIKLGSLSELNTTPSECVAFHRDRGEELTIRVGNDLTDHSDFEYAYLFRDGLWFYKTYCTEWESLTFESCVDQ